MANPFTYSELHAKDAKKARAFYTALFDWKLEPFPVPGREYHAVDAGEGHPGGLTEELATPRGPRWASSSRGSGNLGRACAAPIACSASSSASAGAG